MVDVHEGWWLGFRDSLSYAVQCVGDVVAVVSLLLLFMLLLLEWLCPLVWVEDRVQTTIYNFKDEYQFNQLSHWFL